MNDIVALHDRANALRAAGYSLSVDRDGYVVRHGDRFVGGAGSFRPGARGRRADDQAASHLDSAVRLAEQDKEMRDHIASFRVADFAPQVGNLVIDLLTGVEGRVSHLEPGRCAIACEGISGAKAFDIYRDTASLAPPSPTMKVWHVTLTFRAGGDTYGTSEFDLVARNRREAHLLARAAAQLSALDDDRIPGRTLAIAVERAAGCENDDFVNGVAAEVAVIEEGQELEMIAPTRMTATFRPQAWINDHAVEIDGRRPIDITASMLRMTAAEIAELPHLRDKDHLYYDSPDYEALNHNGPFEVDVEEADIRAFFGIEHIDELTDDVVASKRAEFGIEAATAAPTRNGM